MKKLIFLISLVFVALINVTAQQQYKAFAADTVMGDTLIVTSGEVKYDGLTTFDFSLKGKAVGDTILIDFQGSNDDFTTVQTLSTTTHVQAGSTTTNYHLVDNPPEFLKYRLKKRACEVSDTAYFTYQYFIYKR